MADTILRYPISSSTGDDTGTRPRVSFTSYTWDKATPKLKETQLTQGGTTSQTSLYLPNGFTEKYGAEWGATEIMSSLANGFSGASVGGVMTNAAEATQIMLKSAGGDGAVNTANYANGVTAFPGQFSVFQKGTPISMDFSFEMIPMNQKEAIAIVKICQNFKSKILPTYGSGAGVAQYMLTFPDVWSISFSNAKGIGFPNQGSMYKDMALVSCNVSYGGGAQSAITFYDDNPVCVTLTLSFTGIKHSYKGNGK